MPTGIPGSSPICSVYACDTRASGKGLCGKHYTRLRVHGDVSISKSMHGATIAEKVSAKSVINVETGCLEWTSRLNTGGYGRVIIDGVEKNASRAVYEYAHGPLPDGVVVRHTCDNPKCVNLDHLIPGTTKQNSEDSVRRLRHSHGERAGGVKLTAKQVGEIRGLLAAGGLRQVDIGAMYGVAQPTISAIKNNVNWRYTE